MLLDFYPWHYVSAKAVASIEELLRLRLQSLHLALHVCHDLCETCNITLLDAGYCFVELFVFRLQSSPTLIELTMLLHQWHLCCHSSVPSLHPSALLHASSRQHRSS